VWRWWHNSSIHTAPWPTFEELAGDQGWTVDGESFAATVCHVLSEIRRAKTEAKVSQKAVVENVIVTANTGAINTLTIAWPDLANAGSVIQWSAVVNDDASDIAVAVTLAPAADQ
jgi:valyl-tRNA synthetase